MMSESKLFLKNFLYILPLAMIFSSSFFGNASAITKTVSFASKTPMPKPKPILGFLKKNGSNVYYKYDLAITLAENKKWGRLSKLNRKPLHNGLEEVISWLSFKDYKHNHKFKDVQNFLRRQPIWPDRNQIALRAEALIGNSIPLTKRDTWFSKNKPQTISGKLEWLETLELLKKIERRDALILEIWLNTSLTRNTQLQFKRKYSDIIGKDAIWARLDNFLWRGKKISAQKMYPFVNKDLRLLSEARLRLRYMMGGVDAAIKRIPLHLKNDPGLVYERLRWRNRKGMGLKARELLNNVSKNQKFPKLWWRERSRQIRFALNSGYYKEAYALASTHIQTSRYTKAEADWTAGWIALRYANKPAEASKFFTNMYSHVITPLSKSRAAYWAGRAFKKARDNDQATTWYNIASKYRTTFYGQLAQNSRLVKIKFPSLPLPLNKGKNKITKMQSYIEIIVGLHRINKKKLARKFLKTLARSNMSREAFISTASLASELGHTDLAVYTARRAARKGIFLLEYGHPFIKIPNNIKLESALILSVIRQESNFDPNAKSPRGARGYMQLMPKTAKEIAKKLNIDFSIRQLEENHMLNIRLGAEYLARLIQKFDGNYVLALAAYNAGPLNVQRWINSAGDPRQTEIDTIDWIERIPFRETRNYVQRVLENLDVYRRLQKSSTKPISPENYWRPLRWHMSTQS